MTEQTAGALVRRLRDMRRWSQLTAAEQAEIDYSLLSRIESGKRRLTPATLDAIARGWRLTSAERDQLALAAGLAPTDPLSVLTDEPAVAALYRYLHHPAVSYEDRVRVREIVRLLVATVTPVAARGEMAADD